MLVELLSAALQQQSGFSSLDEMLDKLTSLQLPQIEGSVTTRHSIAIEGNVTTRHSAAVESSVYELMCRIFRFSSYEEPVRQMIRQLSLLSPLGMDREPLRQLIGWDNDKEFRDVLLRLRDLHLVSIDPRTAHISMHPVLTDVAAADLKPNADNCSEMIANAVRYFDEDSAQCYDARHLEQISAMCKRCVMVLIGQKSDIDSVGAEAMFGSGVAPGAGDTLGSAGTPVTVRLSLSISGIDYRLGNYGSASFWAEQAFTELGGWNSLESYTTEMSVNGNSLLKDQAEALKCAARAYAKLGEYDTACEYYEKELELLPEDMESELAVALNDYGVLLEEMGRFEESFDCLTRAWDIQQNLFGPDSPETISTCNNLGLISTDMGDNEAAEMFYRHALRISLEYYKEGHPETAIMYANLGELLMHSCENATGYEEENDPDLVEGDESAEAGATVEARLAESRHYLIRALEITTNAYGPDYPDNACTLSNLGILEDMEGNHKKAREHYRKALEIQSAAADSDHPHCADILHNLGVSYIDEALEPFSSPEEFSAASVDHKRDALPLLNKALACEQKALSILESVFGKSHSSVEIFRNEVEWLENELYSG